VTLSVTVNPPRSQTITATPATQTIYVNQTASFAASGSNTGYTWSTGVNSGASPHSSGTEIWSASGTYSVTVQAPASADGSWAASNVVTLSVTVVPPQAQTITASVTTTGNIYPTQTVSFSASGSGYGLYAWTGATANGNGLTSSKTYSAPGTYTVTVQAPASSNGAWAASNTVTLSVTVLPPQSQTITASVTTTGNIYAGQAVSFSASGSGYGLYAWTGATANGNGLTASKTYSAPGTYTVTVQAPASPNGAWAASNTVTLSVTVLPPQSQTITASPSSQTIYQLQSAYFTASGSNSGYTWTNASTYYPYTNGTARQLYPNTGTYTVTVQAPANGGVWAASNTVTLSVTVLAPQPQPITATPSTQAISQNQYAYFAASGSATGGYSWTNASTYYPYTNGTARQLYPNIGTFTASVQAPASTPSTGTAYAASNTVTMTVTVDSGTTTLGRSGAATQATKGGEQMPTVGGPIQVFTGAESYSRTLFSFSGARNWDFPIKYNSVLASAQTQAGLMGDGWTFPYETSLVTSGNTLVIHWDATHTNIFVPSPSGSGNTYISSDEVAEYDSITQTSTGWTLSRPDQSTLVFDSTGRLVEDHDPRGRKLVLAYNGSGKLASITEPISGTSLAFSYNGSGQISNLTDATGASVTFTYQNSLLASIVNQLGKQVSFTYDGNRNLLTLTDNSGTVLTTNTYNAAGCVATQQDAVAGHGALQLTYQQANLSANIVTTVTDKIGAVWTYTSDANFHMLSIKNPLNQTTTYTYDSAGNRISQTDALSQTTTYAYDGSGNLTSTTDPAGKTTSYVYDNRNNLLTTTDPLSGVTTRTYDANNNLLTLTDVLGRTTTWTYDQNSMPLTKTLPRGGAFSYAYTSGRLTRVTDPNGVSTTLGYDANGRLQSRQDSLGNSTTYTHDAIGNLLTTTNPLNQSSVSTYDYRNRLTSSTDPAGGMTTYTYDNNNNLISSTDPLGNITTNSYDGDDRLHSTTDPRDKTIIRSFDLAGELVSISDATGATTTYQYDAAGRRTVVIDPLGNHTTVSYDPRNLPLTVTDPLGRVTQMGYDGLGRQTSATDPLNHTTNSTYDPTGRLVGVTDPGSLATAQAFDLDGNRTGLTDASGNAASFTYDSGGRTTSATTPVGRTTAFTYDARGLPSTTTLPSGHSATVTYDSAGRPSSVTDGAGTIAYTRDNDGRILTTSENGQTLTRSYDLSGQVTHYTDGAGNTLGYQYDYAGNLAVLTYPDGKTVTYGYDAANRLMSVTDWAARVTSYIYDAAGHLTQTTRPNGTSQVRTYDVAGQLTGLSELGPGGTTIYSETCSYDGASRLGTENLAPSQVTGSSSVSGTYGYDASNRITSWQDTFSNQVSCAYDAATNLLSEADQFTTPASASNQFTGTYDHDNRLLTSSSQAVSFDADGNLLSLPGGAPASYGYDARGRLISADALGYSYNSEGIRTAVTDATGTTQFTVNPNAELSQVLVRTAPNGTVTDYVYGIGLVYEDTGGSGRYYHYDRRGNTVALTDGSGSLLGQASYGIYGQILSTVGLTNSPFLFNGLYGVMTDSNGLYYHRARYYSPQLRRFVSQDVTLGEISIAASLNRYAYANGNPANAIDPFGLMAADLGPTSGSVMIALGYKSVVIFGITTGDYHTFVVATDLATQEQIYTRGGPSTNGVNNSSATVSSSAAGGSVAGSSGNGSSGGFVWGTIYAQGGAWTEGSADKPSKTLVMQPLGFVSMTFEQVRAAMMHFQAVTNSNRIPYFPTGPNSNSYAFTFVQSLGLPRPQPLPGFPAPGSSMGSY
jgi:RHS repeat-associated protein